MHEDRFEQLIRDGDGPDEDLAAKLMGRYRILREDPPDGGDRPEREIEDAVMRTRRMTGIGAPSGRYNDFRFEDDTAGFICPLGAHIRRANPRDALGFDGSLTRRHRIIRRGTSDDSKQLHFIGINARLRDQFEFIQRLWFNTGDSFHLGTDRDIFAGSWPRDGGHEHFIVQGREPRILCIAEPLVELQGGEYFLMPGMAGLWALQESGP
jgi:hypothetical protein